MQINSVNSDTLSFLNEHYDVIYQSEGLESTEEATTFFLPEPEGEKRSLNIGINSQLINTLAKTTAVFLPGIKASTLLDSDLSPYTYQLEKSRSVCGWDFGTLPEVLEASAEMIKSYADLQNFEGLACKEAKRRQIDLNSYLQKNPKVVQILHNHVQAVFPKIFELQQPLHSVGLKRIQSLISAISKTEEMGTRCFIVPRPLLDVNEYKDPTAQENPPQLLREQLKDRKAVILAFKP